MKQLDIQLINSQSPYKVKEGSEEYFFEFFTDHDVHFYAVAEPWHGKGCLCEGLQ